MKKIITAATISYSILEFVGYQFQDLVKKYEVVVVSSPDEALDKISYIEGVRVVPVKMARRIAPLRDIISLFSLIVLFIREKPYMVHSMTPKAGLLCMVAARISRVPLRVHTFTGLIWPTAIGYKRKLLMFTDKITCAFATHIIPEGQGVKRDLEMGGITKKPLNVLGYGNIRGVDMYHYSKRPEVLSWACSIQDSKFFTYLYVGRIVRDKGINDLVHAFRRLNEIHHNTRLFLVGMYEDSLDPISEETRNEIRLNNAIVSVGYKTGDELLSYFAASDCFVFPSYREGFPNTVLEAGAMGLPSIVTDINGSREIIIEGENGIIIPPRDSESLFCAMQEMIINPTKREYMAQNSRKLIENRFEQGFVKKCLFEYYDKIFNNV